jgi:calcineurin-like phosphoesterase
MPCRFDLEESGPMVYSALIVDIDDSTNRTTAVERILIKE